MVKKHLILSCCFFCIGTLVSWATPSRTADTGIGERSMRGNHSLSRDSVKALPQLLADKLELGKKLEAAKKTSDAKLRQELQAEALEFPAIELYGESSWSDRVNPFTGMGDVQIPDTYEIDCNNFVMPIPAEKTHISSPYGYRKRFRRMHYGVDLKLNTGDTVRAAFDGKVRIRSYERKGYGYYIVIRHPNGLETVYGHLSRQLVQEGQIVLAGQPIGLGGNTGRSFGSHLHLETRFMGIPINPAFIFDFENGAPLNDVFVFKRSNYSYGGKAYASNRSLRSKKSSSQTPSPKPRIHRVRDGESLSSIAARYGTTINKICRANGIKSSRQLIAGKTTLRIPD